MTLDEYLNKLDRNLAELAKLDWMREPVQDTHAEHVKQIFTLGKGEKGKIGSYSTREMLATRNQFLKKSVFRLDKWVKFPRAKKAVPVMVLGGGYKEFRQIQGRQSAFVDLNYSGDLFRDFSGTLVKLGKSFVTGVKRKINADKIDGLSKKYGEEAFRLEQSLIEAYKVRLKTKITEILTK